MVEAEIKHSSYGVMLKAKREDGYLYVNGVTQDEAMEMLQIFSKGLSRVAEPKEKDRG